MAEEYTSFERFWQTRVVEVSPLFAYGIYPWVLHQVTFWLVNLPFILLQFNLMPKSIAAWCHKYKVSEKHQFTASNWFQVCAGVLKIQFFIVLPVSLLGANNTMRYLPRETELLPPWYEILFQLFCFMIIEDILFFSLHRLFHVGFLYKWFHSVHHRVRYTTSIAAEYFHPVEYIIGIAIPVLAGPMLMRSHVLTMWIWQSVMLIESIFAHSGYNFPFVPIVDGREHAFHHSHIAANYGSWFTIMDKVFGTDAAYKDYLARKERAKQATAKELKQADVKPLEDAEGDNVEPAVDLS